ncbi:AAL133Wp [Eremothecium gossypii ATCC 10895]|uniref:Methionine--tRNA ligase, mitochondrial n=1 Tax=Eremothecium gossypii (strain ATCC 10895 / CBS 109.51 / FGSC 9923 / NRRL Y-1056) TaxID=284811 RepID=Q75F61_EREGS|nr:AAL133Wp [Eremothecium gossypii ATCC 10895]AAS50233.1 AAL133Wp [Eremothecium gossypii ATCC 10895]AEY94518.1 FAAL133Wp [Eremothecium gossypii FDAG1]
MVASTRRALRAIQKFHITTPIFYPNAKPHLGHLYSSLICDVQARWQKLRDSEVLFTTGTDEHGLKIQTASEQQGYASPKVFVDKLCTHFISLDEQANIGYTRFIRTTDKDHISNVLRLWELCKANGYIYKGEHSGWYSVSDETFYPATKVVQVIDGREFPVMDGSTVTEGAEYINTETRNRVIHQTEVNYFFRLSSFRERLISHLKENPGFILPPSRSAQILDLLLKAELPDLSISRPKTRLKWGISVPGDESQKIYVWFDALCNYVTSIGGVDAVLEDRPIANLVHSIPQGSVSGSSKEWWNATTHLVGKDIVKFHTIYWPAILLAAGLPLPEKVVVHGHWLSDGVKMSKSLGNVVVPEEMIEKYDTDPMRWFILEHDTIEHDASFSEEGLCQTRELLCSKWGNLLHRCGGPKFNIHRAVQKFHHKPITDLTKNNPELYGNLLSRLTTLADEIDQLLSKYDTANALRLIWSIINDANMVVQHGEPWKKPLEEQDLIIYTAVEAARIVSIAAQPFIPVLANRFLDRLDVHFDKRSLEYASVGADSSYGTTANVRGREVPISSLSRQR